MWTVFEWMAERPPRLQILETGELDIQIRTENLRFNRDRLSRCSPGLLEPGVCLRKSLGKERNPTGSAKTIPGRESCLSWEPRRLSQTVTDGKICIWRKKSRIRKPTTVNKNLLFVLKKPVKRMNLSREIHGYCWMKRGRRRI